MYWMGIISPQQDVLGKARMTGELQMNRNHLSNHVNLMHNLRFGALAAFFDDKVKAAVLKRFAMVKDDSTIEFLVPLDIKPHSLARDVKDIPQLQIVMLIGDAPDVAICCHWETFCRCIIARRRVRFQYLNLVCPLKSFYTVLQNITIEGLLVNFLVLSRVWQQIGY